jgi:hypothetical protein
MERAVRLSRDSRGIIRNLGYRGRLPIDLELLTPDIEEAHRCFPMGARRQNWRPPSIDFGNLVHDSRFQELLDRLNLELVAKPGG